MRDILRENTLSRVRLSSSGNRDWVLSVFVGLADTLRSEFILYGIDVHMYLPAGILSPNYEVENRTKPDITKKIEEGDTPMTPEDCVKCLITGTSLVRVPRSPSLIRATKDWREDTTRSPTTFSPISCVSLPGVMHHGTTSSGTGVSWSSLRYVVVQSAEAKKAR